MYFKKEIIISFFIITISASDLYMPMIWLYLFLLDFLIPFLCDPDLQCVAAFLYSKYKIKFLLASLKLLTNSENLSSNPLQEVAPAFR